MSPLERHFFDNVGVIIISAEQLTTQLVCFVVKSAREPLLKVTDRSGDATLVSLLPLSAATIVLIEHKLILHSQRLGRE